MGYALGAGQTNKKQDGMCNLTKQIRIADSGARSVDRDIAIRI